MRFVVPLLFIGLMLSVAVPNGAAQDRDVVKSIERALNKGDVPGLLAFGSDRIAVAVFGEAREYSHSQAEYVLKDFFKTHRVTSFSFDDRSQTDRGMFVQGRLRYRGADEPLQVFVRLRMRSDEWELREIIIRK
ncbi:MAG: DUF4783 domain-containing protein [Bacteroidetes bacterium]|nr:DUF4783 domain-containing protein [Bacteroidota bacterium]